MNILTCVTVTDCPNPVQGSVQSACGRCSVQVWVAPASQRLLETVEAETWCLDCVMDQVAAAGEEIELDVAPGAIEKFLAEIERRKS